MGQYVSRPCARKNDACFDMMAWMRDRYPGMNCISSLRALHILCGMGGTGQAFRDRDLGIDTWGGLDGIVYLGKSMCAYASGDEI
jgi:hypothetical protein